MKIFKDFLTESYNAQAQEILKLYLDQVIELKHNPSPIDYNVIDKEYFFNFKTKKAEFSVYIDRKNSGAVLVNMDNGNKQDLNNPGDLKKYI